MASESGDNALVSWYRSRVGHPTNRNEVYGYWTFVLGAVLALLGAMWIVIRAGAARGTREFGFVLVMVAGVALLAGGTLRLPLGATGTRLSQVGGVVALIGVAAFSAAFPENWNYGAAEIPVIGVAYVLGLGIMALAPVVVPIVDDGPTVEELEDRLSVLARQHEELTVQRADRATAARENRESLESEVDRLESELAETRRELDETTSELAETQTQLDETRTELDEAKSEVNETRTELDEVTEELAETESALSETHTELESVRAELTEAREATAAADSEAASERERADEAEARLAAATQSMASFEAYKDAADEWRWRLVHRNRNIVATSGEGYSSDRAARRGLRSVKRNAPGADVVWLPSETDPDPESDHVVDDPQASVELFEDEGGDHRWRLRHDNGQVLAISSRGYSSESSVADRLSSARRVVGPAEYLTFDPAGFEVYRDAAGEHRWRLVARNGRIVADSGEGYGSRSGAREAVETVARVAGNAPVDTDDHPGFELYEDDAGEHRWRLVAGNGETVADSGEGYSTAADAHEAADRVHEYAPDADRVTVGDATVELFEDEAGEHRWRLRHRNGRLLAIATDGFASRSNAVANLNRVKRHLPNAPADGLQAAD